MQQTRTRALDPTVPFTRSAAVRAGISDGELRRGYQQILHGWWVDRQVEMTGELLRRTALRATPRGSFLSHHSAAAHLGAVVPAAGEVHVGTSTTARIAIDGIHWHRFKRSPELLRVRGMLCTSPAETFIDLSWVLSLLDLVIYADSLARHNADVPSHFRARAVRSIGRGAVRAREAADLMRPRVELPYETRLRMLIMLAGLPEPEVNHEVRDETGTVIYRLDLAYADHRLAFEYDGRHHIGREGQWEDDLRRRERLEAGGWRILVFASVDLHSGQDRRSSGFVRRWWRRGWTLDGRRQPGDGTSAIERRSGSPVEWRRTMRGARRQRLAGPESGCNARVGNLLPTRRSSGGRLSRAAG